MAEKKRTILIITSAAVGVVLLLVIILIACSVHTIDEGNVGIYYEYGALSDKLSQPGVNWAKPFVTTVKQITVRPETINLAPIEATTKDGIMNKFLEVQVISNVNQKHLVELLKKFGSNFLNVLVVDRIREEIRTFCASSDIDEVYNTKFLSIIEFVNQRKTGADKPEKVALKSVKVK